MALVVSRVNTVTEMKEFCPESKKNRWRENTEVFSGQRAIARALLLLGSVSVGSVSSGSGSSLGSVSVGMDQ